MAGMSGAGKSTLALALGRKMGLPVIDKDVILSALLEANVPENLAQSASYRTMFALGEALLNQEHSVVLDSPAALPKTVNAARNVCSRSSAHLVTVLCSVKQDIRNERVATRHALPSQPFGISTTPGTARERFLHLPNDTIEVDTMQPLDVVTREAVAAVWAEMTLSSK